MRQQSVGIVLCALLLTTFGHDILQRHHVAHSARHASEARSPFLTRHNKATEKPNDECKLVCKRQVPSKNETEVAINSTTGLIGFYKEKLNIAILIDTNHNLFALVNQTSNRAIVINTDDQSIVTTSAEWKEGVKFSEYFNNIQSLKHCYESGKSVDVSEIRGQLQIFLIHFEINVFAGEALIVLIQIVSKIINASKDFLVVFKSGVFKVRITLIRFFQRIGGFKNHMVSFKNSVKELVKANIQLDIQVFLSAKSSLETIAYILENVPASFLQPVFEDQKTTEKILEALVVLSGNDTENVNGVFNVLWRIYRINQIGYVEYMIAVLFEYISSSDGEETAKDLKTGVEAFIKAIHKQKLTKSLEETLKVLVAIQKGKWVENNINMSEIIKELTTKQDDSIRVVRVIKILILIHKVLRFETAISTLLLYTIELLVLRGGINIVGFIYGIHIEQKYVNSMYPLTDILKKVRISTLRLSNLYEQLDRLEVIGDTCREINKVLVSLKIKFTVKIALEESPEVVEQIVRTLIQSIKGLLPIGGGPGPIIPAPPKPSSDNSGNDETSDKTPSGTPHSGETSDKPTSGTPHSGETSDKPTSGDHGSDKGDKGGHGKESGSGEGYGKGSESYHFSGSYHADGQHHHHHHDHDGGDKKHHHGKDDRHIRH